MDIQKMRDTLTEIIRRMVGTAKIDIDGHYFCGMDIAIADGTGKPGVYRIIIVEHSA